jgi:hypothetical protein
MSAEIAPGRGAAAAATARLQAVLGLPGTLLAIIAMVVFGDPIAGQPA